MGISRREMLKLSGLGAAGLAIGGCSAEQPTPSTPKTASVMSAPLMGKANGKRVVVVGAGFGGLTVAKELRKASKDIEVVVLEKRDNFMSCPYSNTWMGGCMDYTDKKPVTLDTLSYDYYAPAVKHGYQFIQCEVTAIDRASKNVTTTKGIIDYDFLVLTGGIEYDYNKISGGNKALENRLLMDCPPALKPGSEHIRLKKQMDEMEEGNFVIVVPESAYRCPPAPYERAAMVANYFKNNDIKAKVLILDPRAAPMAKPKQFMAVYKELYAGIIEYHANTFLKSVDADKKTLTVEVITGKKKDEKGEEVDVREIKTIKYEVANIIPKNVGSPLMKMAGIKTNADGFALVKLPLHAALNTDGTQDTNVFVLGDAIAAVNFAAGSGYPKSGHMANAQGKIVVKQLVSRILNKPIDDMVLPDNTCYSMVASKPKQGLVVSHKVEYLASEGKIKVTAKASGENAADRPSLGKATDDWYKGIMNDLFG